MRLVFVCQECSTSYLPPDGLRYPDGISASPVWCTNCQALMAERGVQEPAELAAVALLLAVRALKAALATRMHRDDERRPDRRPSRPARTSRGQLRPGSARGRLA